MRYVFLLAVKLLVLLSASLYGQGFQVNDGKSNFDYLCMQKDGNFNATFNEKNVACNFSKTEEVVIMADKSYSTYIKLRPDSIFKRAIAELAPYTKNIANARAAEFDFSGFKVSMPTDKNCKINEQYLTLTEEQSFAGYDNLKERMAVALSEEGLLPAADNNMFAAKGNTEYRYLLAANVIDMKLCISGLTKFDGLAVLKINWQVFDKKLNKLVYNDVVVCGASDRKSGMFSYSAIVSKALYANARQLCRTAGFSRFINSLSAAGPVASTSMEESRIPLIRPGTFKSPADMIKRARVSVVTIKTEFGHGSGFVISADGYILTNYHVIEDAAKIEILLDNNFTLKGTVIKHHKDLDAALIKVDGDGFDALPLLADLGKVNPGEEIFVIGTPADISLGQTITKGVVSGKRRFGENNYIQTDASVNPGNSGGPIINSKGEVIGIATLKSKDNEGIALGIATQDVLNKLMIKLQ